MKSSGQTTAATVPKKSRRTEVLAFLLLAFGIWPIIAVCIVGSYGFVIWMLQIVYGPPGPPGA